jgi:hypothetical protein
VLAFDLLARTPARVNPDETQQLIALETPAARQLRAGFQWLRFERELEREFRREQAQQRLPQIRLNLYLAFALVLAFGGLNTLVLGSRMPASIWVVQFGVLLPVVCAALIVTHLANGRRIYPRVAPVLVPIANLAVIAIELQAAKIGVHSLFATVVLASVFTYYLVGLLFYEALRANALTWGAYVAFGLASGVADVQVVYNALVLLCANVVGASVAYGLETVLRAHFLEARRAGLARRPHGALQPPPLRRTCRGDVAPGAARGHEARAAAGGHRLLQALQRPARPSGR